MPSRDVALPRATPEERARILERQSSQRGHSESRDRANRGEAESRSIRREQQIHDALRDREPFPKRESLQRRDFLDDAEGNKRDSGRSFDSQNPRKTPSKETPIRGRGNEEDRDLSEAIDDLQLVDRRRSIGEDQRTKDSARTSSGRQDDADARQLQTRKSQSRDQDPRTTKNAIAGSIVSEKIGSNETTNPMEIPKEEWACEHCTFINKINDRVCVVCCKTRSSALPPSTLNDQTGPSEPEASKSENPNVISNPKADQEKRTKLLKVSNSEESGDSGSFKNKGRPRRKISFSFGTKLSK